MESQAEGRKTMFEIYRESRYGDRFHVVYFTELDEHRKEREIDRAMAGESVFDGFLRDGAKGEAKRIIAAILARLNGGEPVDPVEVRALLGSHLAD